MSGLPPNTRLKLTASNSGNVTNLGDISGYPSWQDFIPSLKAQALITYQLSNLSYEKTQVINQCSLDANNKIIHLGTIHYFTQDGHLVDTDYTSRFSINVPANKDPQVFDDSDAISFPAGSTQGYYKPKVINPLPYDPSNGGNIAVAFHCYLNSAANSNYILDTLQFFAYQALQVVTDTTTGEITNIVYQSQVDLPVAPSTVGIDYFYYNPLIAIRGTKNIQDILTENTPQEIVTENLAIPKTLRTNNQPFYANEAAKLIKLLASYRTFQYLLSPFSDGNYEDIRNQSLRLSIICLTGHSYGGAIANMTAKALIEDFIPKTATRFTPTVYVETYSFESPPYEKDTAAIATLPLFGRDGSPLLYSDGIQAKLDDFLLIRNFINNNDGVCSLNVPNLSTVPVNYTFPTQPFEIYKNYRMNRTTNMLEIIKAYDKESAISLPLLGNQGSAGLPLYLAFNNDHDNVFDSINNITVANFDGVITGTTSTVIYGEGSTPAYKLTRLEALKALINDMPQNINKFFNGPKTINVGTQGYIPFTNIKYSTFSFDAFKNLMNTLR
jgi:hypothetical protein